MRRSIFTDYSTENPFLNNDLFYMYISLRLPFKISDWMAQSATDLWKAGFAGQVIYSWPFRIFGSVPSCNPHSNHHELGGEASNLSDFMDDSKDGIEECLDFVSKSA